MTVAADHGTPNTTVAEPLSQEEALATLGRYEYGWADSDTAGAGARRGLGEDVVRDISAKQNEPEWIVAGCALSMRRSRPRIRRRTSRNSQCLA